LVKLLSLLFSNKIGKEIYNKNKKIKIKIIKF